MKSIEKFCSYRAPQFSNGQRSPCQFTSEPGIADQSITIGGLSFCPYHLPFSVESLWKDYEVEIENHEAVALKERWDSITKQKFNSSIQKRIIKAETDELLGNLTGVVFASRFVFSGKDLHDISFRDCRFQGTKFEGSSIYGFESHFDFAEFCGFADFSRVKFYNTAQFPNTVFHKSCSFTSSEGNFDFTQAEFWGDVNFSDVKPSSRICFSKAHLQKLADFSVHADNKDPVFTFKQVEFWKTVFNGPVTFSNRRFTGKTQFEGARFHRAPEFHGCSIHQDTTFPPIEKFKDTKSAGATPAYRTLRLAMKQQEAHDEEAMFWALEQRSKRNSLDRKKPKNWLPWGLSWGYDVLSNYGLSAGLPLFWIAVWTNYLTLIYAGVSIPLEKPLNCDHFMGALEFSIAQMARPFFIWADYDGADIKAALGSDEFSFLIKMLATFDSIVSLTLIALFILAVRRRFRMQ